MTHFVRELLSHVSFEHLVTVTLATQPKLRYKAMRELVTEVFLDKRAEAQMCSSANILVMEECKDMEQKQVKKKGGGLLFRYLKCELCKRYVDETSKASAYTSFLSDYDPSNDSLALFECDMNRADGFNHVFHQSCIRAFIRDELNKGKRAQLKDSDIESAMRCPECQKINQTISGIGQSKIKSTLIGRGDGGRASDPRARRTVRLDDNKSSGSDMSNNNSNSLSTSSRGAFSSGGYTSASTQISAANAAKSMQEWKQDQYAQRMKIFGKELDYDTLELSNFRSPM